MDIGERIIKKGGNQMNIGERIIKIRKERKMTQEDFAKIFHVTRQTVSNWEHEKSYPDLQTIIQISDEFNVSLDALLKEDLQMVRKIDNYKKYKKVFWGTGVVILSILVCIVAYMAICTVQHKKMYDKVEDAGFKKEWTEEFIEKYQGYYALTEDDVDYLVEPKSIGKYQLDNKNFILIARKGEQDITLMIDKNKKITLALYPGEIEIDQEGRRVNATKKMTKEQKERENELLNQRKEELIPILHKALELWGTINN